MVPIASESERREKNKKGDIGKSINRETLATHLRRRKSPVTRSMPRRKPRVEEERKMKKMKYEEREKKVARKEKNN